MWLDKQALELDIKRENIALAVADDPTVRLKGDVLVDLIAGALAELIMADKLDITELDADDRALPKDPATRDQAVAKTYESFLSVALAEPAVIAVLTWGLSDRYTYFNKMRPRADGAPARPLPLDADLKLKPAYDALARVFDAAPTRPGTGAPK